MKTLRRALPIACLLLGACTFLEPREDPTQYFVLEPQPAPMAPIVSDASAKLTLVVGPIQLPDYLLRSEIVWRAGPNQVEPSRMDRWAEPLDRAFLRVMCLDVAALLPRSSVVPFPAVGREGAVQVQIEVVAFEAARDGTVRLEGSWRLRDGAEGGHTFRLARGAGSGRTAAVVGALSGLVGELAGEIVKEVGSGGR